MSTNRTRHVPRLPVPPFPFFAGEFRPATSMDAVDVKPEIRDVKPEFRVPKEPETMVLRMCDAASKRRKTEGFKVRVAQRRVEVDRLRAAKERSHEDLQAHPHVGLSEYGGPEHAAALETCAAASKTYQKAKKRLGVLSDLLEKMQGDMVVQEYLVKKDLAKKDLAKKKDESGCTHDNFKE